MNKIQSYSRYFTWFIAMLMTAVVAGCGSSSGSSTPSASKSISAFSLAWTTGTPGSATGTIDQTLKTIRVTVPFGTNLSPQFATFTTTGTKVTTGSPEVLQVNGTTANDFTNPVAYKVTAEDGTWATYTVIVTVSSNSAKAMTAFSLAWTTGTPGTSSGTINELNKTIAVTVPFGTSKASMKATFTSTGTGVTVLGVAQASGTTVNDFTNPVTYTVTAGNASTADYIVTVTLAANTAKAITAYSFVGYSGYPGVITGTSSPYAIAVTVPNGTTVSALTASFTTTGASVQVGSTVQVTGTTPNNFGTPVTYIVTAADASTANYVVTVTVAAAVTSACTGGVNCINLLTAGNYVIFSDTAIGNPGGAGHITGDIATGPGVTSTAITGFALTLDSTQDFSTSALVTGKVYAHDYTGVGAGGLGTTPTAVNTAANDMLTAYNEAAGRPAGVGAFLNAGAGSMGGLNLAPGVYTWTTAVTIPTDVTLTGNATDVWIFQIAGDLTVAASGTLPSGVHVILAGTAKASNIFWQVGGLTGTTLGDYSTFNGNILSAKQIIMGTGAVLSGRALAQTAVSMITNTVTPAP